ncbi:MAG: CBS domain-containing protein [Chloroflexi bacterium]|nr:MAG: CBS domain-containing protein [Chloroflexota bacterium]MBL1196028.1 CBS domain-containing protein [Chloroflexota bacterium]NOH13322.1 CBS domain-containing protein [Chloroflexota bacterium]
MTTDPITISPKTHISEAYDLMQRYNVRRLPVVENEKVVGIISFGDVREAGPSDASSLTKYEVDFLVAKLTVEEIMTQSPKTLSKDASLHDAAQLMLDNKIGGLPVLDGDKLVGMVTESDVFRAVLEVCG